MNESNKRVNKYRRDFLKMLGKTGISTGVLRGSALAGGLIANRFAQAQNDVKRLCVVWCSNGSPPGLWLPNSNGLNTSTKAYEGVQEVCNFRESQIVNSGHGLIRKALGQLRWVNDWTADTLDQQIASVIGTTTPFQSIALGVQTLSNHGGVPHDYIGRKSGMVVVPQDSPETAFNSLFGYTDWRSDKALGKSVLDVNRDGLNRLKNKLGQFERETLDKHISILETLEMRLGATPSGDVKQGNCGFKNWNALVTDREQRLQNGTWGSFGHHSKLQSDIIVNAFACGMTNVATLQLGGDAGDWVADGTQFSRTYHNSCHAASKLAYAEMSNYVSSLVAYLLRGLIHQDDPAAPGTKLIDNTVLLFVTNMGDGRDGSGANGPGVVATRMPNFKQGTVTKGGNNLHILDAVTVGMGLESYMGKEINQHKIWPHGNGTIATELLA